MGNYIQFLFFFHSNIDLILCSYRSRYKNSKKSYSINSYFSDHIIDVRNNITNIRTGAIITCSIWLPIFFIIGYIRIFPLQFVFLFGFKDSIISFEKSSNDLDQLESRVQYKIISFKSILESTLNNSHFFLFIISVCWKSQNLFIMDLYIASSNNRKLYVIKLIPYSII